MKNQWSISHSDLEQGWDIHTHYAYSMHFWSAHSGSTYTKFETMH